MKINVNGVIKNLKGEAVKDGTTTEDLTVKTVCINSLLNQTNENIGGLDKYESYQVVKKLEAAGKDGKADLKVEEIGALKELIQTFYNTLVVGQAIDALEGNDA